jgi:hypothetical protein
MTLVEQFNAEPGRVLPTVVGTIVAISNSTLDSLNKLYITERSSHVTIVLLALRNSIAIHHTFMDYDAPAT